MSQKESAETKKSESNAASPPTNMSPENAMQPISDTPPPLQKMISKTEVIKYPEEWQHYFQEESLRRPRAGTVVQDKDQITNVLILYTGTFKFDQRVVRLLLIFERRWHNWYGNHSCFSTWIK